MVLRILYDTFHIVCIIEKHSGLLSVFIKKLFVVSNDNHNYTNRNVSVIFLEIEPVRIKHINTGNHQL